MSVTRFQALRGPTVARVGIVPLEGELVFDTTLKMMFVGDGETVGGNPFSGTTPYVSAEFTEDASLSGLDCAIANSASAIEFQLPTSNAAARPIDVGNIGAGVLTVVTIGGQQIYTPVGGPTDNIQLVTSNSVRLLPVGGKWVIC